MPKLAANVSMLFAEVDFLPRFALMEGNLALTIERLLPRIGHLQIADVPGRNEPGTGEINFEFLLDHIDRLGYRGWIGCEYNPMGDTREGLKWARRYLS